MWSGFSSEIETKWEGRVELTQGVVACGAASHLRLKPIAERQHHRQHAGRMWSGFSSEIETSGLLGIGLGGIKSHVERLLI